MIISQSFFTQQNDEFKMIRHKSMILPKDLVPCDFDAVNNLLELEDMTDGSRHWIKFYELPRLNYKVGQLYIMMSPDGSITEVVFQRLESILFRGRHYLSPVFSLSETQDELPF